MNGERGDDVQSDERDDGDFSDMLSEMRILLPVRRCCRRF